MKYFVVLEQREGVIKEASRDVWNTVQHFIQAAEDGEFYGAVIGAVDKDHVSDTCGGRGCVYIVEGAELLGYNPAAYVRTITELVAKTGAENVFIANTAMGKDLSPRIAVHLDAALVSSGG